MEYISVIRNELGEIVRCCMDYSAEENEELVKNHPEYYFDAEKKTI